MYKKKNHQCHIPVLTKEVIHFLAVRKNGIHPDTKNFGERVYIDGTLGGGGHAELIARRLGDKGRIIGIDQDQEAIDEAKLKLVIYKKKVIFVHDNFRNLELILNQLKIKKVDGILLDLGVSSYQLEKKERGFSFKTASGRPDSAAGGGRNLRGEDKRFFTIAQNDDNLLDMRMDQQQKLSAVEVINDYSEEELRQIFFEFGEERFSRQIAREIVKRRREKKILTADDLIVVIKSATPPGYRFSRRHHFSTKIFQALRIEVNQELEALREVLPQAVKRLKKGGRLVVISFHSLEDRIVKHFFKEKKNEGAVEILTKKPLAPTFQEIRLNPRAESAKLRAIERI